MRDIPFNRPVLVGKEYEYINKAIENLHLSGNGPYTKLCQEWLEFQIGCKKALLTNSCTAALEMAAILADIQPGDEVIMPSFTFVSTANAFVLRGGVPVFVDIRPDTLNINEDLIEAAITSRTKVIVPVHYAGVGCEMDKIMTIAKHHDLIVIEDAAQGLLAEYKEKPLGSIAHMSALSFHETKNVISGEGGALLINRDQFIERAEIIWEKGTNRNKFFLGQVDKYTWIDIGSSYLPSELTAAFLWAQLEQAEAITEERLTAWNLYQKGLKSCEESGKIQRPHVPATCNHNAHIYYIILPNLNTRNSLIDHLRTKKINTVFHYIPLHSSPAGQKYGRVHGSLHHTNIASDCLCRLPLWSGMGIDEINYVTKTIIKAPI